MAYIYVLILENHFYSCNNIQPQFIYTSSPLAESVFSYTFPFIDILHNLDINKCWCLFIL